MTRHHSGPTRFAPADIAAEIARIGDLDAASLRALWPTWFDTPVPARMRKATLALVLAHRIQSMTHGGLTKTATRTLDAVAAEEFGERSRAAVHRMQLKPGTRLVREYHGRVHEVDVIDDGYVWNGTRYRSLSAIARAITGTHWNGIVFFGLKPSARPAPP